MEQQAMQLFESTQVRMVWNEEEEKWYFSVVDVIKVLTDSVNPRTYWKVLKSRLKTEGNETVTNCNQLKLQAQDGKKRLTDVADMEQLLRIIQSIPSPKAEPLKQWLAEVGSKHIAQDGGGVAKVARQQLEKELGKSILSPLNAEQMKRIEDTPITEAKILTGDSSLETE